MEKLYEAWNNITQPEVNVPVPRTTATFISSEIMLDSGHFLWTVLLMDLTPQAGSPFAEAFPRDTHKQHVQLLDAYGESLFFYRTAWVPCVALHSK